MGLLDKFKSPIPEPFMEEAAASISVQERRISAPMRNLRVGDHVTFNHSCTFPVLSNEQVFDTSELQNRLYSVFLAWYKEKYRDLLSGADTPPEENV